MTDGFSPLALKAFELFFRPWMGRRVRLCLASLPDLPDQRPLLIAANHTSWWDPFVLREMQRAERPSLPMRTLMLEAELARRPFFRRIGVIGIDPESPSSIRRALRTLSRGVAEDPRTVISFFPQGRIWPSTRRPLGFRRGIDLFARKLAPLDVLPLALHLEGLNAVRPTIFALPGDPLPVERGAPCDGLFHALEAEVARGLDHIHRHVALHGEDAPKRWPELLSGRIQD